MRCSNPACEPFGEPGLFLGGEAQQKSPFFEGHNKKVLGGVQGGPRMQLSLEVFSAIYTGYKSIYIYIYIVITSRGPGPTFV